MRPAHSVNCCRDFGTLTNLPAAAIFLEKVDEPRDSKRKFLRGVIMDLCEQDQGGFAVVYAQGPLNFHGVARSLASFESGPELISEWPHLNRGGFKAGNFSVPLESEACVIDGGFGGAQPGGIPKTVGGIDSKENKLIEQQSVCAFANRNSFAAS